MRPWWYNKFLHALPLTKEKGESYSTPSHVEGTITMMSKKWRRRWEAFGEKLTFMFAPLFVLLIRLMPLSWFHQLARALARVAGIFPGRRKKIALANLRLVFGKRKGEEEIQSIYRKCLTITTTTLLEAPKFCYLSSTVINKHTEIIGRENLDEVMRKGKGVIIASIHLGNFPLIAVKLASEGYPVMVIIKQPRNKHLSRIYKMLVDKKGFSLVDPSNRKRASQNSLRQLRQGGILYLVIDQNPPYKDIMVEFFGYPVPSYKGPIVLAMRTDAAILPTFVIGDKKGRNKIVIEKPFSLEITEDTEKDIVNNMARLMRICEGYIERYPEQWWWWHRRWKQHIDYKRL
jgi:KDO2-lipid IV(A) lauroyltransferase